MILRRKKGDLIEMARDGQFDAIAHGCNCFHAMGSGIAVAMRRLTNDACFEADLKTPYGDINKLGTFSECILPEYRNLGVYNLYTQYTHAGMHKGGPLVSWDALIQSIDAVRELHIDSYDFNRFRMGIPLIGCGLAGGLLVDFNKTMRRLEHQYDMDGLDLTVVEYE